jgi:hypothetical protein
MTAEGGRIEKLKDHVLIVLVPLQPFYRKSKKKEKEEGERKKVRAAPE